MSVGLQGPPARQVVTTCISTRLHFHRSVFLYSDHCLVGSPGPAGLRGPPGLIGPPGDQGLRYGGLLSAVRCPFTSIHIICGCSAVACRGPQMVLPDLRALPGSRARWDRLACKVLCNRYFSRGVACAAMVKWFFGQVPWGRRARLPARHSRCPWYGPNPQTPEANTRFVDFRIHSNSGMHDVLGGRQVGSGSGRRYAQGFLMPGAPLYADSNAFKFITIPPVQGPDLFARLSSAHGCAKSTDARHPRRSWRGRRTS